MAWKKHRIEKVLSGAGLLGGEIVWEYFPYCGISHWSLTQNSENPRKVSAFILFFFFFKSALHCDFFWLKWFWFFPLHARIAGPSHVQLAPSTQVRIPFGFLFPTECLATRLSESALFLHRCSWHAGGQAKSKIKRIETNSARLVKVSDRAQFPLWIRCSPLCPFMLLGTTL